jgi:hypothetical protein
LPLQRVIGLRRRRTGLPVMCAEITRGVPMPRRARPGRQIEAPADRVRRECCGLPCRPVPRPVTAYPTVLRLSRGQMIKDPTATTGDQALDLLLHE